MAHHSGPHVEAGDMSLSWLKVYLKRIGAWHLTILTLWYVLTLTPRGLQVTLQAVHDLSCVSSPRLHTQPSANVEPWLAGRNDAKAVATRDQAEATSCHQDAHAAPACGKL